MGSHASKDPNVKRIPSDHSKTKLGEQVIKAMETLSARARDDEGFKVNSIDRLILKFPSVSKTFKTLKQAFDDFDRNCDGTLDHSEVGDMMKRLGFTLTEDETKEIFFETDIYPDGKLIYSEFVACIAVGYVLDKIPVLSEDSKSGEEEKGESKGGIPEMPRLNRAASEFYGNCINIRKAFKVAIDMYICFDKSGAGVIKHEDMEATMHLAHKVTSPSKRTRGKHFEKVKKKSHPSSDLLTEARWKEMDWDKNGRITFQEFMVTFVKWVADANDEVDTL